MRPQFLAKTIIAAAVASVIVGCTPFRASVDDKSDYVDKTAAKLQHQSSQVDNPAHVNVSDEIWLGPFQWGSATSKRPAALNMNIAYSHTGPVDLKEGLKSLTRDSGVLVMLNQGAENLLYGSVGDGGGDGGAGGEGPAGDSLNALLPTSSLPSTTPAGMLLSFAGGNQPTSQPRPEPVAAYSETDFAEATTSQEPTVLLNGSKTLEGWLDAIAIENNLFWEYTYVGDTNTPFLYFTPTKSKTLAFEGLKSDEAGDSWSELMSYVQASVSDIGTASFSEAGGRIYIEDRPDVISKIEKRVNYENAVFSRQIHYNILVLTVDLNENESYRGGLQAVYDDLKSTFSLSNGLALGGGVTAASTLTDPGSTLQGSNVQASLSDSMSRKFSIREYNMVARNKTSVSRSYVDNESIVAGISTTTDESGATATTPSIESLSDGVQFNFIGHILEDDRISLNLSLTQDYVKSRLTQSFGGETITLPKQNNTEILDEFIIKSGRSIILSDAINGATTSNSGPSRHLGVLQYLLGASSDTDESNSLRFIIITPTIVEGAI